jgi:hypothetical protein
MIKILKNLPARIALSLLIAFFIAGAGTHIQYPCQPETANGGCVSFEKAVMHLGDLQNNVQDSRTKFIKAFVLSSLGSFAVLSLYITYTNRKKGKK